MYFFIEQKKKNRKKYMDDGSVTEKNPPSRSIGLFKTDRLNCSPFLYTYIYAPY